MNKIPVTKSSMPPFDEYVDKIKSIWDNVWLTNNGPLHQELEDKLKKYLKVRNLTLFSNGHLALMMALKSLNLKGEVITTPFTFASTTHAIVQNGLIPVFCDIDPNTYTIDANKIEELITDKTTAIVAVHVYGNVCDLEKIENIAEKHNLKVIYDSAHAFGVEVDGKAIGIYGDINMFSLHATKVFHTIEGGLLSYKDPSLKLKLDKLKNFGIQDQETIDEIGINSKMNEFQAAMGLCNLKYVNKEIKKRKKIVEYYNANLKNIGGIKLYSYQHNVKPNYIYFPILVDKEKFGIDRDELLELLKKNNIYARKYFYPLTCDFDCYKGLYKGDVKIARMIAKNVLTLPLYADLKKNEVIKICDIIRSVKK